MSLYFLIKYFKYFWLPLLQFYFCFSNLHCSVRRRTLSFPCLCYLIYTELFNLHSLHSSTIKIIYAIINHHNKQQKLHICNCTVCLAGERALENGTTPAAFCTATLLSAAPAGAQSLCNSPVRDSLNARTHSSSHGGISSWVCYVPRAADLVFSLPKPGVQPIAHPTWACGLSR